MISAFSAKCVLGIEANEARCRELVENSLAMVAALAPSIGYDAAAMIAHKTVASNKTVLEVAQLKKALTPEQLEEVLEPLSMTMPGGESSNSAGAKKFCFCYKPR